MHDLRYDYNLLKKCSNCIVTIIIAYSEMREPGTIKASLYTLYQLFHMPLMKFSSYNHLVLLPMVAHYRFVDVGPTPGPAA